MREAVIVIADLYLQPGERPQARSADSAALPALEHLARFGERAPLERGWREWLTRWLGRGDLAALPVAEVAAASRSVAATDMGAAPSTRWIATPVELLAGLTRLHLPRGGIVRLTPADQAALVSAFGRVFAGSRLSLEPLSDGQLLLTTPGIAPLETVEPARCAGGEVSVPQGPDAAALLHLMAEIEMWLHAEPLNETRRRRGAPAVTGLWLWGAGRGPARGPRTPRQPAAGGPGERLAFGEDAWLSGLWHLMGSVARPVPARSEELFCGPEAGSVVAVVDLAGTAGTAGTAAAAWSLEDAVAALDARVVAPARAALRAGALERLTLIANDTRVSAGRLSSLKRWRRRRAGLEAFA